ncbi:serine/threonine-protein kinase [Salinibacterium amurskyense]|uniref:non-specific serine/threonine protein kinase n=1 Tax=Salinibacterium amurskyense TaxID=205941 RepID=A0A2M9D5Q7_9MICO|nr:Stk1 family PASTA domain-containing Ser/Thr kinase [Salinibacterium amurskyense]PJJ81042.1 serine/threonine-protein kinase [Salinibacterium amurskyense]RLQ83073.1 Stk1 family PASTA domain-containing Ser/Thr kinase [Salinibacterium amurskyense]GHD81750.1 serine/threonine-protein kinase PknB [Salinibacterium amurskyense]
MSEGVAQGVRQLAGRYQIGELLGHGGMADVHLGMDSRLGRRVAIKLLKPTLANDPAFRTRFRREAHDAAKMAHPTIVRIFDAGEESVIDPSGHETLIPFIIMEYVDGRLLKDIVAEGPLAPEEAARIVSQVLTALEYSHRAGVVHRDIKPGNIMVTNSGQVKVMDFGIARAVSDSAATIAESSAIVGTAQYFSPEQARGEGVDARSDLYSTGVVLFELLTGQPPFSGENPVAVAYKHVNSEPVPPSTTTAAVSPALDAVVLRSLAKDRFDRYQSAAEFRTDVESAAAGSVPERKQLASTDFNATLFGVNPNATAGSDATFRQLAVDENDRTPRTQNRPPVAWIWGGIALMAVIIVSVVVWAFSLSPAQLSGTSAVDIPDVAAMTYDDGAALLTELELVPKRVNQASETVDEGVIIRTDPGPGQTVSLGFEVQVIVSLGRTPVTVPNVANMQEDAAIKLLESAGLVYGSTSQTYSPNLKKGTVISSDPRGDAERTADGAIIREGETVNLVVSNGLVQVPDVTGKDIGEANSTLTALQLSVKLSADFGCSGNVVSYQSIVGDQAQKSEITLQYCAG